MKTTTTEMVTARNEYRKIRAASGIDAKAFDAAAIHLVHEISDGEEVLPRHWIHAAHMAASGER